MKVISALTGNKVALWERNPAHPGGEVFVVGDRVVEVALTTNVSKALKEGRLVEVEEETPETGVLHSNATIDDVNAAIAAGEVTAKEALEWEQARPKPRVTLVEDLEALIEEEAGDSESDTEADEPDGDSEDSEESNGASE